MQEATGNRVMPPHLTFFIACMLFILGVLVPSVGAPWWISLLTSAIAFAALAYRFVLRPRAPSGIAGIHRTLLSLAGCALLSLLVIVGTFYYLRDDYHYVQRMRAVHGLTTLQGIVTADPERGLDSQTLYLNSTDKSAPWKVLVRTGLSPEYAYGDALALSGKVKDPPPDSYGQYLEKEKVHGTMQYPKIERLSSGNGNPILSALFRVKNNMRESYKKLLTRDYAALLAGITLSDNGGLSPEFLNKLSLSGTRHLTAIAGLHMMIVTTLVWLALVHILPRRYAFLLTFALVGSFVAMTGFKASAVRAAIMGVIAWSGKEVVGRPHAAHNALVLAALAMIVVNPKVLVFDVGFQLSFLAAISIIYFMPVLQRAIDLGEGNGFLGWKQSFFVTISAQIAVAPILITQFQNFSLTAFIANVVVLPAIPLTMALGFFMGLSASVFYPLAQAMSFVVAPLVGYVSIVINVFSSLAVVWNPSLGVLGTAVYYAVLIFAAYRFYARETTGDRTAAKKKQ